MENQTERDHGKTSNHQNDSRSEFRRSEGDRRQKERDFDQTQIQSDKDSVSSNQERDNSPLRENVESQESLSSRRSLSPSERHTANIEKYDPNERLPQEAEFYVFHDTDYDTYGRI